MKIYTCPACGTLYATMLMAKSCEMNDVQRLSMTQNRPILVAQQLTFPYRILWGSQVYRFREDDHMWYAVVTTKNVEYTAEDVVDHTELTSAHRGPPIFNEGNWVFFRLPKGTAQYTMIARRLRD